MCVNDLFPLSAAAVHIIPDIFLICTKTSSLLCEHNAILWQVMYCPVCFNFSRVKVQINRCLSSVITHPMPLYKNSGLCLSSSTIATSNGRVKNIRSVYCCFFLKKSFVWQIQLLLKNKIGALSRTSTPSRIGAFPCKLPKVKKSSPGGISNH